MNRLTLILALVLLASPALAQENAQAKAKAPQLQIDCRRPGPFAGNSSHANLVKYFGAKNVTTEEIDRGDGERVNRTVLFAKDPTRRLEFEWLDPNGRTCPTNIFVSGEKNRWLAPYGVRIGTTLADLTKRNGKPFPVYGFNPDGTTGANFWETRFGKLPGRCALFATFEIEGGKLPERLKHFNDKELRIDSNDPGLLSLKPKIRSFTIGFPPEC
jgi:hypothetical protein